MKLIKFNIPYITNSESVHLKKTLKNKHFDSSGFYSSKCKFMIAKLLKSPNVLLTSNCTGALEIACLSLNLNENDEVIIPSYTFVSAADVFLKNKVNIKFCDIDDKFVIDLNDLKSKITSKTKDHSQLYFIPNAGHMAHIENTQTISGILTVISMYFKAQ
jgi:dTDP-4-amino-4,6-dideoxygalactose transaminase